MALLEEAFSGPRECCSLVCVAFSIFRNVKLARVKKIIRYVLTFYTVTPMAAVTSENYLLIAGPVPLDLDGFSYRGFVCHRELVPVPGM